MSAHELAPRQPWTARAMSHQWAALAVVLTGTFMVVLDFFIVNVAMPAMQADLHAGTGAIEWVIAGYGLTFATFLITAGPLGDQLGRRRMFSVGLAAFTLASAACGLAPSPAVLVGARLVQGLAAALLSPQVLSIIGVVYDGPARVRAISIYGIVLGWRSRFLISRESSRRAMHTSRTAAVDLYWIPLGAGGRCVRLCGRVFEALQAAREHRRRCDLYHAALLVELDGEGYTIELAPSPDADTSSRGVVATGAVGSRCVGWARLFRYEVRCCRGGSIPDLAEAVGGPCRLTSGPGAARRLLDLVAAVPGPVWGRDELKAGEMWNSNSMIAWLIASAGLSTDRLRPPPHGRAPGWDAGLVVARRSAPALRAVAV